MAPRIAVQAVPSRPLRVSGRRCAVALASLACLADAWPWSAPAPTPGPELAPQRSLQLPPAGAPPAVPPPTAPPGWSAEPTQSGDTLLPEAPAEDEAADPKCEGEESQWAMCTMKPCGDCIPHHCEFTEWANWRPLGGCSGLGVRRRSIDTESNECGRPCQGPIEETIARGDFSQGSCLNNNQDCEWGPWGDWSHCGDCNACTEDRTAQTFRTREMRMQALGDGAPCTGTSNMSMPCGLETPIDCDFTEWSEWTQCSASCGGGWKAQIRRIKREAEYGGMACEGNLRETFPCNTQPCGLPRDCKIGDWTDWNGCSGFKLERNMHQMMRHRMIQQYAANGGEPCDETVKETMGCPEGERIDWCTYSPWTTWTACTATCDSGQKERSRTFRGDKHCKQLTVAPLRELHGCSNAPCEGSCQLSQWSEWETCSEECGTGMTTRSRKVEVAASSGRMCMAALKESKACMVKSCDLQDCKWGDWEAWSACTSPCAGGLRRRVRAIEVTPMMGGAECEAKDKMQVEGCNMHSCEDCIDGVWSTWKEWSPCSGTCFPAYRHRSRSIMQKANHCGRQAEGPEDDFEICAELKPCEASQDCELSQWTEWTDCSSECFGASERHRTIVQAASLYGRPCEEKDMKEVKGCNPGEYDDVPTACLLMGPEPCRFGEWEEWSGCSATCDGGQKTRTRTIISQGMHGGAGCKGSLSEMTPCNTGLCDPNRHCVNCEWSLWGEWGECSGCGGQRYRQRSVVQTPNWCGRPCDKDMAKETELCVTQLCGKAYCAWAEWEEVGECSATCGTAVKMRKRKLSLTEGEPESEEDALMMGTVDMTCEGTQTDLTTCSYTNCDTNCPVEDCEFDEWGEWSEPACTQLCSRHRLLKNLNKCNGKPCNGSLIETKACEKDCGEALNCVLSEWNDWTRCNVHQSFRKRTVEQEARNGGLACPGSLEETRSCETDYSPSDCELEDWADWSSCTKLCDSGTKHRSRRIGQHSEHGGAPCSGDIEQFESCNLQRCAEDQVRDCILGSWSEWMHCDSANQQKRKREIDLQPLYGGIPCNGSLHEVRPCTSVIDCIVSPWAAWDECDKSCDGGQQQRQRQVVQNPRNGGKGCPADLVMIRGCNEGPCPSAVNCKVSSWSSWSECSSTCGAGYQERARSVTQRLSHCGEGCKENLTEVRGCSEQLPPCTDCKTCKWGEWTQWTSCSRHCGGGQHHRHRNITRHPDPGCGPCDAREKVHTEPCNILPCSDTELCIDGAWNDWQDWATCSTSCEGGETYRMRSMRRENTACGKPAEGLSREEGPCMVDVPCTPSEDCLFGEWGAWSDCSASCAGVKKRSRIIAVHGRGKEGKYCEGPLNETSPCAFGRNQSFLNWRSPNLYMVVDKISQNNLASNGPMPGGEPYIRFDRVVLDPSGGTWLDLLVMDDASGGRHYTAADSSLNGKQGVFGNINVQSHTAADLTFQLVESGTLKPVVVNDLLLKFFDLDPGTDDVAHTVQVHGACEEHYVSQGSHYIAQGECSPSGNQSVAFRKPIFAQPQCDQGNPFDLDLSRVTVSNLAGKGPDVHLAQELRYDRVAVVDGTPVDMVLELKPGSHYDPAHTYKNGYNGRFGRISLLPGSHSSFFNVRFINANTKGLFKMPKFNFTFYDIDGPSGVVRESVEVTDYTQWYFPNGLMKWSGRVAHHKTDVDIKFTSTEINVTDPANPEPTQLTPEQQQVALTFFFQDRTEFSFGLHVIQTGPTPGMMNDREFIFAGKYCVPWSSRRLLAHERGLAPTGWEGTADLPSPPSSQATTLRGVPTPASTPAPPLSWGIPGLPDLNPLGFGEPSGGSVGPAANDEFYSASAARASANCPNGAVRPFSEDAGPASLTPSEESRAIAIRFRGVREVKLTLGVNKGDCGHNFLFAGKVCVSGACDDCRGVAGCRFSTWQEWGKCDAECGGGSMNRTRNVQRVPLSGGQVAECAGAIQTVKSCNTHSCTKGCRPVDCKWDEWTEWTSCHTCEGSRTRHRGILQHAECQGLPCEKGDAEEIDACEGHCNGGGKTFCAWDVWSPWTACSVSCGCGRKQRTRVVHRVSEPPPELQRKFEYDELKAQLDNIRTKRLQVMIVAFSAGCLTFIAGLLVVRSCRRLRSRRRAEAEGGPAGNLRDISLL